MNDEIESFEAELRRRRPTPLPRDLVGRIGDELAPRRHHPIHVWWWVVALPAAAALALAFTWPGRSHPRPKPGLPPLTQAAAPVPTASGDTLAPVSIENVLFSARDEGLVRLDDGAPARRQRLHFIDTITWQNPDSNVFVVWTFPREEVRIVRVVYY